GSVFSSPNPSWGTVMTPLPGSLGDLVGRANGGPVCCLMPLFMRRELIASMIGRYRREFPAAVFINARSRYRTRDEWRWQWPRERDRYGAGIIVTCAEDVPANEDPFAGIAGEHAISIWAAIAIEHFIASQRPVAWHALVFPAVYWMSRFEIELFN